MSNSSQNLATIVKVSSLTPIPDADKIVKASMEDNAWQTVVPNDAFAVGDLGVFFVIDSIVDSTNPALAFMAARKNVVWPCKMKKCLSQGLLIPLAALSYWGVDPLTFKQGDDVTAVTKTSKRIRDEDLPNNPMSAGSFPSHIISKTDELNFLSNKKSWGDFFGLDVSVTLKMDGSSSTFLMTDEGFTACSRSLKLKPEADNAWNRLAQKYGIKNILSEFPHLVIQGEACGPKLNGNRLGLSEEVLYVFDVFNTIDRTYMNPLQVRDFCDKFGLKSAPIVRTGVFDFTSFDELLDLAAKQKYDNGAPAEGIVIRANDSRYSDNLGKRLSVKVINPEYKTS